ncbi:MAG: HAD-IIB family hydrolase [Thermoprotei archaeon]|nr:HAD-IIB family hydrolase [Thermoprotei archaeon]
MTWSRLVLTDIDGSMISYSGDYTGIRESIELLKSVKVKVIPVTAKTLAEVVYLDGKLDIGGGDLTAIVEMGGSICSKHYIIPGCDHVNIEGYKCCLIGRPLWEFKDHVVEALRDCDYIALSQASPQEAEVILGIERGEAILATKRVTLEVLWSQNIECLKAKLEKLKLRGLEITVGRRFIHVGTHYNKGAAVNKLIETPIFKGLNTIGIGDSEIDLEMLETVEKSIIVPQEDGTLRVKPRRSDHIIAPYPAPKGWVWTSNMIALGLI